MDRAPGGDDRRGDSAWRPYMAMRRSAASVLRARSRASRWMSMTMSGSSRLTAKPSVSPLSARPGPLVVVTPRWPPKLAPRAAPMLAISSSAWSVRTPKFLWRESSWMMSGAGVMGCGQEERELCELAGSHQPPREGGVAGDVRVGTRLVLSRLDLVGVLEELGRLAEGVPGLEGRGVGLDDLVLAGELGPDPLQSGLGRTGVHPREHEGEEVLGSLGVPGLYARSATASLVMLVIGTS